MEYKAKLNPKLSIGTMMDVPKYLVPKGYTVFMKTEGKEGDYNIATIETSPKIDKGLLQILNSNPDVFTLEPKK